MVTTQEVRAEGIRSVAEDIARRAAEHPTDEEILLLLHDSSMADLGAELCFRKYEALCMRLALRWTTDDRLARDTALDILSHFIEREVDPSRASFQREASVAAYLAVSIRNAFRDHYRRHQRHESSEDGGTLDSIPSPELAALDELIASEQRMAVQRCLQQLTPREFQILTLRFIEEPPLTLQQIGNMLGLVPSSVFHRIKTALHHLKELLEQGANHAAHE